MTRKASTGSRLLVKTHISPRLSAAGVMMATLATEHEASKPHGFQTNEPYEDVTVLRVMEFAASAVVMSVAALEGILNEIFSEATDSFAKSTRRRERSPEADRAEARWAAMWKRGVPGRGYNALDKVQILFELADQDPLPEKGAAQNLRALITLRNELVHSQTIVQPHAPFGPDKDRGSIEKLLASKFEPSRLLPVTVPFVWARCLSAGCARWAVDTRIAVGNEIHGLLGTGISGMAPWQVTPKPRK